ncbi:conserved hypothetical protein [Vibrio crassostreae]|nr:conserved hypothetical protein [Vibrio crassostreae]
MTADTFTLNRINTVKMTVSYDVSLAVLLMATMYALIHSITQTSEDRQKKADIISQ